MSTFGLLTLLVIFPSRVQALTERSVTLTTGIAIFIPQMLSNIISFAAFSAVGICTLIFLLGAGQLVISHGDTTKLDTGKKMMIGALIGLAIILGAYGILRTVLFFLYNGSA